MTLADLAKEVKKLIDLEERYNRRRHSSLLKMIRQQREKLKDIVEEILNKG